MDIGKVAQETARRIKEHDYILDKENFYELSTDTIHIRKNNFRNPMNIFVLAHEVVHALSSKMDTGEKDITEQEHVANDVAFKVLRYLGVPLSPRMLRTFAKILK